MSENAPHPLGKLSTKFLATMSSVWMYALRKEVGWLAFRTTSTSVTYRCEHGAIRRRDLLTSLISASCFLFLLSGKIQHLPPPNHSHCCSATTSIGPRDLPALSSYPGLYMKISKCKSWSEYGGCRRTIHPGDFNIFESLFSLRLENRIFSIYQSETLSTLTLHFPIKLLFFVV